MSRPGYEINRLSSDELSYELEIRGISGLSTIEEMRKALRQLIKLEKKNNSFKYPAYPFKFNVDSEALSKKLIELQDILDTFDGSEDSIYKKLLSKLSHAMGRINLTSPTSEEEKKIKSSLMIKFLSLKSDMQKKIKSYQRKCSTPLTLEQNESESTSSSDDDDLANFSHLNINLSKDESKPPINSQITVPIHMWNLKFTGENSEMSVSAFLEKVEELAIARHVPESNLFDSILELLDGKALCWYRSIRKNLSGWKDFSLRLREQFQPPDYNSRLFEEIKERTQGREENIGMYVAIMNNLFGRLSAQISEQSRLQIILKNLTPYYQRQLGTSIIENFEDLLKVGKLIELRNVNASSYVAPITKHDELLEPDLGYKECRVGRSPHPQNRSTVTNKRDNVKCFKCGNFGHVASNCNNSKQSEVRKCFGCNKVGFTVRTCPRCSKNKSGNGQRRQS